MPHQLDFLARDHIIKSIQRIDIEGVPKDNEWSEYWIYFKSKLYQFKYTVQVSSNYTNTPIKTTDFKSNESSRKYIANLGFHILFKSSQYSKNESNYWVGASYYGLPGNQIDMMQDFIRNKYWRTDHDITVGEGLKIYFSLSKVQINDRICIRYLDKKGSNVHIAAIGTVTNTESIGEGKLNVNWDYNPPEYKGPKPSGQGSGNWWKTLIQLKGHSDIALIFSETLIEKRVARITWNDYGWIMPSGPYGKSEHKDSHEAIHGYGHEEWLFDTSKIIDGYHYGFLEPVRKEQDAYIGKNYNVWLYTINGVTKKRFWVGEIENLIVIDNAEASNTMKKYFENGWLEEMEEQIKASGANIRGFSNWKGIDLFNVKFKPSDISTNDPYFELDDSHPIYEQSA